MRPLQWRGCVVDVAQRTVRTMGLRQNVHLTLQPPQAWSLGVMDVSSAQAPHIPSIGCVVELRHVRRGPVLVLCSLEQPGDHMAHREQLEELVDDMAQRLGIRRSGTGGLLPARHTRRAAPVAPPAAARQQ